MKLWRLVKLPWVMWRAKRRYKKYQKGLRKKMKKNPLKSRTTQDVAVGAAAGGGTVVALIALLRQVWPDFDLWPADQDPVVAAALATIVIPLVSRAWARIRDRLFGEDATAAAKAGLVLLCAGLLGLAATFGAGCKTTQHPDGTVVTEVDAEALQAVVAMTLDSGDRLLSLIAEMEAGEIARDQAELEQRLAQWQYAYELAVDLLERVQGLDLERKAETLADLKARLDSAVKRRAL